MFPPGLLMRWGTEAIYVLLSPSLLAWVGRGGTAPATLYFPNRISSWEGQGAILSLSYELILLPVHNTGTFHTRYWLCSEGDQFCSPISLLVCHWASQFPGISGQMGVGDTLHSGGAGFSTLLEHGQTGL